MIVLRRILQLEGYLNPWIKAFRTGSLEVCFGVEYDFIQSNVQLTKVLRRCTRRRKEIQAAAIVVSFPKSNGIEGEDIAAFGHWPVLLETNDHSFCRFAER